MFVMYMYATKLIKVSLSSSDSINSWCAKCDYSRFHLKSLVLHSALTLHVPHNQSTSVSFGRTHTPLPTTITKTYPQINVSFRVCNNVFISATATKKISCLTWIPQHSYWPNLKHTPSVYKLNIILQLQAIIYDNFLNLSKNF